MSENNLFKDLTREEAQTDELWDAIQVKLDPTGSVVVSVKTSGEVIIPKAVLLDQPNANPTAIASLWQERAALDIQEIERIIELKLEDLLPKTQPQE